MPVLQDARDALRASLIDRAWHAGPRIVLIFSPIAGLFAGSFSVTEPSRLPLMLYSAVKMPILVLLTTAICLPAFFVLHVVMGRRDDFAVSIRGVLGGQAVFALCLAAMSPIIPVWYSMIDAKRWAVLGAGFVFLIASAASLISVRRCYQAADKRQPIHRVLLGWWFALYALVGIQLGWMLRPFIGSPELEPGFLREDPFTNGYVVVIRMILGG